MADSVSTIFSHLSLLNFIEYQKAGAASPSRSPKSKVEPLAQLPNTELLCPGFPPLCLFAVSGCAAHYGTSARFVEKAALWSKPTHRVRVHKKSQENKPWHREGEVREVIFNEKGELLVANESLSGVCVSKMPLQTLLINTGVVEVS